MNNKCMYGLMLMSLAAGSLIAVGCNQMTAENLTDESSTTAVSSNANEGCCGQCGGDAVSSTNADGCCGKCVAEATTESAEKIGAGCQGECNACADGDSANCKCGDTPAARPAETKSNEPTDKANSHINTMPEDRDIFHFLLENHKKITRTVTELDNGVKTVTESTAPEITAKLQEHVASMYKRVEDGRPLRIWDELYREIFKHADKIKMELKNTENGISVTETSQDEYVVKLIQAHAKAVTGFSERGFEEARQNHEPPSR